MSSSSSSPRFRATRGGTQRDDSISSSGRPSSDRTFYDDADDMVEAMSVPATQAYGPTPQSIKKLNQVLQVCPCSNSVTIAILTVVFTELLREGCYRCHTGAHGFAEYIQPEQLDKSQCVGV